MKNKILIIVLIVWNLIDFGIFRLCQVNNYMHAKHTRSMLAMSEITKSNLIICILTTIINNSFTVSYYLQPFINN